MGPKSEDQLRISRMIPLILSIDDDQTSQILLAAYLKDVDFCHSFVSKADGQEALEYLQSAVASGNAAAIPDLIFLDIKMPVLDGWGFLKGYQSLIAALEEIPPVIMVSATNTVEDTLRAEQHPLVASLILKPVSGNSLLEFAALPSLQGFFTSTNEELAT